MEEYVEIQKTKMQSKREVFGYSKTNITWPVYVDI